MTNCMQRRYLHGLITFSMVTRWAHNSHAVLQFSYCYFEGQFYYTPCSLQNKSFLLDSVTEVGNQWYAP